MPNLEDLILYENENSRLDFKEKQYRKEQHHDLIKDVLSMANAHDDGFKYIIFGVKHFPDGNRNLVGIPEGDFIDPSNYQQIIKENIEPDLDIDYSPYKLDNKIFGILSISNPDRPYLLKKDMDKLKKGTCFIRKGSVSYPISRADLERIYNQKFSIAKKKFEGQIKIGFADNGFEKILELRAKNKHELNLRSQREVEKIKNILEEKILSKAKREEERKQNPNYNPGSLRLADPEDIEGPSSLGGLPYEQRAISTLKSNIKNVEKIYEEYDCFELAEIHSFKVNIKIFNEGSEYIEDAYIQLRIHNPDNVIFILNRIYKQPNHNPTVSLIRYKQLVNLPDINQDYPKVTYSEERKLIIVKEFIGDIRHHLDTLAFKKELRICPIFKIDKPTDIKVECSVAGKNLSIPIEEKLIFRLIP
jgi:hypothetical protein